MTVYAVDFDGTLCGNSWPLIGDPNLPLIQFLQEEQEKGNKVILWTMREEGYLEEALDWLMDEQGFVPDEVNDNLRELKDAFRGNPRKIYADVYIDDHNARYGVCAELPYKATP